MIGGIFEELFSPGRKHTNDEHNRLALARDDDHEQGGPGPIDLDKGVVVIRRTVPAAAASDSATGSDPAADSASASATDPAADADASGDAAAAAVADDGVGGGAPGSSSGGTSAAPSGGSSGRFAASGDGS